MSHSFFALPEICVLFLHHQDDELTRHHAKLIQELNPRAIFVPLSFESGLSNAFLPVQQKITNKWASADLLVYNWFQSPAMIEAKRYFIIEYDTLCTVPFHEFYSNVWHAPAACARIMSPEDEPNWQWFTEIPERRLYGEHLLGLSPLSGIMLSYGALKSIAPLGMAPLFAPLFSECRIGTLVRFTGNEAVVIRPDIEQFISWQPRLPFSPGIWHPVKTKIFSSSELDVTVFRDKCGAFPFRSC